MPESYYIKEENFPLHDLECDEAYTVYEAKTEKKVAGIETGVNLFNIYTVSARKLITFRSEMNCGYFFEKFL